MKKFEKKIVYKDEEYINLQQEFLSDLLPLLNSVRTLFDAFGFGKLNLIDLSDPINLNPIDLLKNKAKVGLKNPEINGLKLDPEKVVDLMHFDIKSEFVTTATRLKEVVKQITLPDPNRRKSIYFDSRFFTQNNDGEFVINTKYFTSWCEKSCIIFTKSNEENDTYDKVEKLANCLNELYGVIRHPRQLAEDQDLSRLLFFDQGKFRVNFKLFI